MKILSLIMARAGSKRLKNKNLKRIKKYNLVERSINISKQLKKNDLVCDTLLSTDSKILSIGKKIKLFHLLDQKSIKIEFSFNGFFTCY